MILKDYLFSRDHLWVLPDGRTSHVGLSDFFLAGLDDLAFLELPDPGVEIRKHEVFAVLDTIKCTHELPAPVSGKVADVNTALRKNIFLIAESPFNEGWLVNLSNVPKGDLVGLMDRNAYVRFCLEENPA